MRRATRLRLLFLLAAVLSLLPQLQPSPHRLTEVS